MKRFEHFVEAKTNKPDSSRTKAIEDMANALRDVFKQYTLQTRRSAFDKLMSRKGQEELRKLLMTPKRSLNTVRTLWSEAKEFSTWLKKNPS